ncbi:hypothetical protein JCGZ_01597 [Jatropha curcas]|uniref:Cold regulated protein 27 n=1 Tax=Jatropha curcas TaxID=180498 RepID=A0A067L4Z6_JATCU|nr:hypothetical protein JCGZ_01597 [Jatropha curcas]
MDEKENLRHNMPSASPDHGAMTAGCVTELTRTNSNSSAITADSSKDFSLNSAISAPGPCAVWTDEKHRLYLDSLEASFVNQLHHSIALRDCLQEVSLGTCSSEALSTNSCNPSHQFMVLQDGSWKNITPKRNKPLSESTSSSRFVEKNILTGHFTSTSKRQFAACHDQEHSASSSRRIHGVGNSAVYCGSARSSQQHPACSLSHDNPFGIAIEVSDQNFEDKNHKVKSSSMSMVKRLKIVGADSSSNDQVVPLGYSNTDNVSTAGQASSVREEQVSQELLSEKPDNSVYPKSNHSYFLRES